MNIKRYCACLIMLAMVTAVCAETTPSVGDGQLGVPLSWQACGDDPNSLCMVQKTRDGVLYLTPNESFFPMGGLVAAGQGQVPYLENLNS